ncbi:MAG: hypothetical protein JO209_06290 [Acidisphaera sp.]|nr:hypothetical protein [Acidisphaera sp.]
MRPSLAWLVLPIALAGCGDLPRPFMGRPGAQAMRLLQPPPPRLAVPPPREAMLGDGARDAYAAAVAEALLQQAVPAVAGPSKPGDWRLVLGAKASGDVVVPSYTVENPKGEKQGSIDGAPVPAGQWAGGDRLALVQEALGAAPGIATLLTGIEAAIQQSDPNSLVNRPARVVLTGVAGAPGDGDQSLALQMRRELPKTGEVVQDSPGGADFSLAGKVTVAPGAGGTQRVEIQWIVADARGDERGRIVQINEVPPGTLDQYWGDVALVVAQQAAGGIKEVILNQTAARQLAADQRAAQPEAPPAPAPPGPAAPPERPVSLTAPAPPAALPLAPPAVAPPAVAPRQPSPTQPAPAKPGTAQPSAAKSSTAKPLQAEPVGGVAQPPKAPERPKLAAGAPAQPDAPQPPSGKSSTKPDIVKGPPKQAATARTPAAGCPSASMDTLRSHC